MHIRASMVLDIQMPEISQRSTSNGDLSHSILGRFLIALTMSIDYPKCLPCLNNFLVAIVNADPPNMPIQPGLIAWLISGDLSDTNDFQRKLKISCHHSRGKAPIGIMTLHRKKWGKWCINRDLNFSS